MVRNRLDAQAEKAHFFGVCDTPSWTLDLVLVKRGDRLSSAMFSLGLSRLSGFYISNVAVPYFLIGSGAVLTSGIEPQDYASRLQCMVSLFLTLVAIKFVASFLPVISYSTLLDYYTLVAYIFLAVWMVENFLVSPLFVGGGAGPAGGGSPSGRVLRQRVPAAVAGHPRHHHDRELLRHLPKALERGAAGRRGGQSSGAQGDQLLHQRDSVGVAVKRRVYLCLLIILLCSVCCSVYFRLKIFALLIKVEIKP